MGKHTFLEPAIIMLKATSGDRQGFYLRGGHRGRERGQHFYATVVLKLPDASGRSREMPCIPFC